MKGVIKFDKGLRTFRINNFRSCLWLSTPW